MKRILIGALALVAAAGSSFAQDSNATRLGVKVAFDRNIPSTDFESLDAGSGFSFGAVYNIPLSQELYFEPGLSFFYNTMDWGEITLPDMSAAHIPYNTDGTLQNCGFRVPLTAGYRVEVTDDIALSGFTGPQINYGITMRYAQNNGPSHSMYGNGFGHFDAQWLIGARFHYIDNWFAELSAGIGLNNMLTGDISKSHHLRRNTVSLSVGYFF